MDKDKQELIELLRELYSKEVVDGILKWYGD